MNGVNYLAGEKELCVCPLPVYSEEAISFLSDFSEVLMKIPESRRYPDIMSVAFWCRKSNIIKLKNVRQDKEYRIGRGLAFHIAPSNVPVNFIFSYFFALLAGNASVVRVPSKPFPQVSLICKTLQEVLERHPEIKRQSLFISYPAQDELTAKLCAKADLRIIWGGDQTVTNIRHFAVKPKCIDVVFADRYSICALNGDAILRCEKKEINRLAERFYNDTYLMDQNACSSPQLVLWKNGRDEARKCFWKAVGEYAASHYTLQEMTAIDKYIRLCEDAIDRQEIFSVLHEYGNILYRGQLSSLPIDSAETLRGKGGYFYEYDWRKIEELRDLVDEKYQTMTYYGFEPEELRKIVIENRLRGIDRIVPVGSAMDIGIIWDGYDMVGMLSRIIQVE